jgi:hypothetical protein
MARNKLSWLVSQVDLNDPILVAGDGSARYAVEWRRDNPGCDQRVCGDPLCQDLYHINHACIAELDEYRQRQRLNLVRQRGY